MIQPYNDPNNPFFISSTPRSFPFPLSPFPHPPINNNNNQPIPMNRISYYNLRLSKIVGVGHRNIDTYYFVLSSDKTPHKLISKSMRIDEDN